ncbi:MAG TPA: pyruvate kinase [Opitutae bacterium]|nr:pyruvate kinase [Opitutae bacterium]
MEQGYRHTKIIFTIGPASSDEAVLERLIRAGADTCRLNMAHATHEWTREIIRRVRRVSERVGKPVAIMMDVKGPEIRTGVLEAPIALSFGDRIDFVLDGAPAVDGVPAVSVNYPGILEDVAEGAIVLVDNGLMRFRIIEIQEDRLKCEVVIGGMLTSRRHVNLPGTTVNLPPLTEKDKEDIAVATEEEVDFIALSFVREARDVELLRDHLREIDSPARIISKIEDQTAIANMDAIIEASDAIMVARGDLGIECPYQTLPVIQRKIIQTCIRRGKAVIVATHMLESMIDSPIPTRAEVSDVANAVFEKADCIMLSGETTVGKYPVECIEVMSKISLEIENTTEHNGVAGGPEVMLHRPKDKMLRSAVSLARDLRKSGIIVFTRSGYLAQMLASMRPMGCPISAFTDDPVLYRQMKILWGIEPFLLKFSKDAEVTIREAFERLKEKDWVQEGDWQVIIINVLAGEQVIDSIQMRRVE